MQHTNIAEIRKEASKPRAEPFAKKGVMEEPRIADTHEERIACLWMAMGEMGRGWFGRGKIPDYPKREIAASSKNQGAKYAIWIMSELGLDEIIRFANRGGDAKKAMEAIEKFASEYQDAGTAAKYYMPESYVITAMALAHSGFRAMKEHGFADRTFKAANAVRSKEMDPYHIHGAIEAAGNTPDNFFPHQPIHRRAYHSPEAKAAAENPAQM